MGAVDHSCNFIGHAKSVKWYFDSYNWIQNFFPFGLVQLQKHK